MTPTICLAPLKGITDAIFRTTYAEFFEGIDWAITPFLTTVQGTRVKPHHLRQVLPENNRVMPVIPQIISKRAANFVLLAKALSDLGYSSVNWNLGCPYPMVARKGRGSGMLPNPDRVVAFLDRVLTAVKLRLSIKMRLGRFHVHEIETLLPRLNGYPIESIVIHPRTGVQMYSGRPDLASFEKCLALTRHPVIYNGDIVCPADYEGLQARFPQIKTWMIGRGVIIDPFLPSGIKWPGKDYSNPIQHFRAFHDRLFERYQAALSGPSHLLDRMKGLWRYFSEGFESGREIRKQIHKSTRIDPYLDVVQRYFDGQPARIDRR
jgi:tRNA-dihydrouridine synthase B